MSPDPDHQDLLRCLAKALDAQPHAAFPQAIPDDVAAARFFLRVALRDRCPRCDDARCHLTTQGALYCAACRRVVSLTSRTSLRGTHLAVRVWLAAVWHVFVDPDTTSARSFSRRYGVGVGAGWRLLHDVREAIPYVTAREAGATAQILGRQSPGNEAHVTLSTDGAHEITAVLREDAPHTGDAPAPFLSLWLGRLTSWITEIYRGVTRRYLRSYLAEFAHRYGKARAVEHRLDRWGGPLRRT